MFKKETIAAVTSDVANYAQTSQDLPTGENGSNNHSKILTMAEVRQQAEKGNPICISALGVAHLRGDEVEKDLNEAVRLLTEASILGESRAKLYLGYVHFFGEGVDENVEVATQLLNDAVKLGELQYMADIGVGILKGSHVEQNHEKAIKWLELAVQFGCPKAMLALGYAKTKGLGVDACPEDAIDWYQKAAALGLDAAQELVGTYLLNMDGIVDIVEADAISRYLAATNVELVSVAIYYVFLAFCEELRKSGKDVSSLRFMTISNQAEKATPAAKNKKHRSGSQDTKRKAR